MTDILTKHPSLRDIINNPAINTYICTDEHNNFVEQWERDADGNWNDVTARELARQELTAAQEELEKLIAKENKINERDKG